MAPSNTTTPANTSTTKATMTTMAAGQESEVKGQPKEKVEPVGSAGKEKKKAEPTLTKDERFQKLKNEGNTFFKKVGVKKGVKHLIVA